jgi:hypothetical protein
MLPPTTAIDVQMVCPKVAPVATPIAFLCVASCIEVNAQSSVTIFIVGSDMNLSKQGRAWEFD